MSAHDAKLKSAPRVAHLELQLSKRGGNLDGRFEQPIVEIFRNRLQFQLKRDPLWCSLGCSKIFDRRLAIKLKLRDMRQDVFIFIGSSSFCVALT
jgi:hypothetical protein